MERIIIALQACYALPYLICKYINNINILHNDAWRNHAFGVTDFFLNHPRGRERSSQKNLEGDAVVAQECFDLLK
jgi:hypothetical protein